MVDFGLLGGLGREVRLASRALLRSPLFTLTSLLTLAVCIGANTALFSVVDAVLLRPLPYPNPDQLALVISRVPTKGTETDRDAHTAKTWFLIRDSARTVAAAPFSGFATGVNFAAGRRAEHVQQERVGAEFFPVLGISPFLGRGFLREEDRPGGPAVVVLSYDFWQRAFQADPSVVGRTVLLRSEPHVVIGVMPKGFVTPGRADLWTPLRPSTRGEGEEANYQVVTRLHEGVTPSQANAELAALGRGTSVEVPKVEEEPRQLTLVPLQSELTAAVRKPLFVLWAAATCVLLIACVNIAGLFLARGARRATEFGTRLALGAGRGAIVRQLLTESLLLAAGGGLGGLVLAFWANQAVRQVARESLQLWQPMALDGRVLLVMIIASLLTSVVFGLPPAWHVSSTDVRSALAQGGRGGPGGRRRWGRRLLVVVEVALGVVLLVSAGLLVRTFLALRSLPPGFDPSHVITAQFSLNDPRYGTTRKVNRLFTDSLARLREESGVESAAVGLGLPYERFLRLGFQFADGAGKEGKGGNTTFSYVTPGYFRALRIPLLRGRLLRDGDGPDQQRVTVVNEAFMRRYLPEGDAIGRTLKMAGEVREVVGVVGDVQQQGNWGGYGPIGALPAAFIPAAQVDDEMIQLVHTWFSPSWVVRTLGSPEAVVDRIQRAVQVVDPQLPVAGFRSMEDVERGAVRQERFQAILLAGLAGLALLLAALGICGVVAHAVVERRREVGIRLALGATRWQTMREVALPSILLSVIGVVLGFALSRIAVPALQHMIWGVPATDPATLSSVAVVVFLVATVSSLLPTLRLVGIDPSLTLRDE